MKPIPLNKPLLFMSLLALCNPIAGNSERDEKAYIVQTDRGLFIGQIDNGQLHGHGILFLKNGDYFIGTWTRGSLEGPGAWYERLPSSDSLHFSYHFVVFANNRISREIEYDTCLIDDMQTVWYDCHCLAGNCISGQGMQFNGMLQSGSLIDHRLHGFGVWIDGMSNIHVGTFKDGQPNGQGVFLHIVENGSGIEKGIYRGIWRPNQTEPDQVEYYLLPLSILRR